MHKIIDPETAYPCCCRVLIKKRYYIYIYFLRDTYIANRNVPVIAMCFHPVWHFVWEIFAVLLVITRLIGYIVLYERGGIGDNFCLDILFGGSVWLDTIVVLRVSTYSCIGNIRFLTSTKSLSAFFFRFPLKKWEEIESRPQGPHIASCVQP